MASNFGITIDRNSDGFGLKLAGDFDATSAYELIYAIKKLPEDDREDLHSYEWPEDHIPFWLEGFLQAYEFS